MHVETANTVTNLQQRVVHPSGAYTNKGLRAPEVHDPNELHRQGGRVEELAGGSCGLCRRIDPGHEEGSCRDRPGDERQQARETKYGKVMEEHTNLWRLLRRITEGESKKVVRSIKDEDGFRAWQRLKQRFEPGLASWQGTVMAEFSGMVAQPPRPPEKLLHC